MGRWHGLDVETEGTGISQPLSEQVNLLGAILGQVTREEAGEEIFACVEELRRLCKRAANENDPELRATAEARIRELDLDQIVWLLRVYTAFFHLVNQAEQQEIIRINRSRSLMDPVSTASRPESIDEAVRALKEKGCTREQALELLSELDIQPTLTAHPTEARRRSILSKQQRIAELLTTLRRELTPEEEQRASDELYNQIAILLATDEVRAERPSVEDEVRQGLYYLQSAIWEAVPRIHDDVSRAFRKHYGASAELAPFLRYRSWIGSDRDGNPNVTPAVTRWTLATQRETAIRLLLGELRALRDELSLSDRRAPIPNALQDSLREEANEVTLDEKRHRQFRHEPYRMKVSYMEARLEGLLEADESRVGAGDRPREAPREGAYDAARFVEDLRLIRRCLEESGFGEVARRGRLSRLLVLARTFGFHMAALDVRQHSRLHETTVAALLRAAGVTEDYTSLSEAERLEVLAAELQNPRPLVPHGAELPETARMVMDTFAVIRDAVARDPESIGSYIVSMTHTVSDLLEPMLLAKEAGMMDRESGAIPLDFVPLFETIEDLDAADERMRALFTHPVYRKQLAGRGGFQEIMLGYSDSNKDGGYWMANWALHKAQERLGRVCREHDVDFRLFHGRGGTVGRGGGRANQAILAMPPVAHNGRIRFTEQGEVISFRYAQPEIARRHVEQIVNAMIRVTAPDALSGERGDSGGERARLMDRVAESAMRGYRELIDDPELWSWYTRATPIEQISRLPIASRPVSRKSASEVDFASLRAIPWVFAWTQARYIVPGWYGSGRALEEVRAADPGSEEALRKLYREWPFFQAVVNNAQREMARARLDIARHYAALAEADSHESPRDYHDVITRDFERARAVLLRITGQEELLDNSPVIQKSISLRNPYTDVLNLLQIELIRRYRHAADTEKEPLRQALFLSINGIAAAMQATG